MCRRIFVTVLTVISIVLADVRSAYAQRAETRDADAEAVETPPDKREDAGAERPDPSRVSDEVVRLTNEFRAKQGRQKVKQNERLATTAREFAEFMARTGRYGHTADGNKPADRARKRGYAYCLVSENIAYQFNSGGFKTEELARAFTRGWIESPGHRRNMLNPDVLDTGVAVARSGSGTYYAVQMFGRPESAQVKFEVSNQSQATIRYRLGEERYDLAPRVTRTHTRCLPGELRFDWPDGKAPPEYKADRPLQPKNGVRYVIRQGAGGRLAIREHSKNDDR